MPDGVDLRAVFVGGGVVDVHWDIALVNQGPVDGIMKDDEAARPAADGAQPVGRPDQFVEDALLAGELVDAHAADPIEDLNARWALQGIDVADLPDTADGKLRAVGRECQTTHAADRADALDAVPGVERRCLDSAQLPARLR